MLLDMSESHKKESQGYIKMLERAGKKYSRIMLYAYADSSITAVENIKDEIGKVPGALLRFNDKSSIHYPSDWPFDDSHIDQFVEMVLKKKLNRTHGAESRTELAKKIHTKLRTITFIHSNELDEIIFNSDNRVLIFFFTSAKEIPELFIF